VYGYFFERCFAASMLSVHVGYPPRRCEVLDDLEVVRDKRVLILEDDVASGTTLRYVASAINEYGPQSLDLYLGSPKESQVLDHIDPAIGSVYLAEDYLKPEQREERESQFVAFFERN
jgi:hypoxanthine phosphoribosyltransferase